MIQRPILFSGPMVRAILGGRKTQTRRVVKPQADSYCNDALGQSVIYAVTDGCANPKAISCPYGVAGDRLWVRETWGTGTRPAPGQGWRDGIEYRADEAWLDEHDLLPLYDVSPPSGFELDSIRPGWHSSIYMPRWASRIDLEIVAVRVERLQEISEEDARAEGVEAYVNGHGEVGFTPERTEYWSEARFKSGFAVGWDSINGKRAPWESNPWVWVLEFRRVKP